MDAPRPDVCVMLKADLVRGSAACARDAAEDLTDGARALRAKGQILRRHIDELRATSLVLQVESERLVRRRRDRTP